MPAAGLGTRLRPYTETMPKGIVEVGGRPLLARTLEQLAAAGIDELVCVTGHAAEALERTLSSFSRRPPVRFVHNERYASANSIVSLALTMPWWDRDFCVVASDVCVVDELLERLLRAEGDSLAVDTTRPAEFVDMGVEMSDGRIRRLAKDLPPDRMHGEFFGLSRWTTRGAAILAAEVDRLLSRGRTGEWYEAAISAAAGHMELRAVPATSEEWVEIDSPADLWDAEALVGRSRGRLASAEPAARAHRGPDGCP